MRKGIRVIGVSMENIEEHTGFMTATDARKTYKIRYNDLEYSLSYEHYQAKKYKWFYEDVYNKLVENNVLYFAVEKARDHYINTYYKRQIVCIDRHGCKFIYNSIKEASDDTKLSYNIVYNQLRKNNKKNGISGYKFYYRYLYDHTMRNLNKAKQTYLELM